ncbi:MAG: ABC transporter substrate-binding protein [Gaiellaceae bacterium]
MRRKLYLLSGLAAAVFAAVAIPGALGSTSGATAAPGVTARTVTIGGTFPISGPASLYAPIAKGMEAYFSYINARRARDGSRGVYGRQIIFKVYDDQYNPALSVQLTRRLVEQDKVFAVVGGLGTEPQTPVRPYLNQQKVPQLFVSTGATTWGADHKQYKWTIGWQPDYQSEGSAYGQYLRQNDTNAKVGVLLQNDAYGEDYLRGFKVGLRTGGARIVGEERFEVTATSVATQVTKLRAAGADAFLILATPRATIQALVTAFRLGWRPKLYVNSVSATDSFLTSAATAAGSKDAVEGAISTAYLKDPASPRYARDATVLLYKRLMAKFAPGRNANDGLYFYGMAKADTFVQTLYRAGKNPTRESVRSAAVNLKFKSPWLIPGSTISSSSASPFPISIVRLIRYSNNAFVEFGPLIKTR